MGGQAYFDELMKYIFTYLQLVVGNLSAVFQIVSVASNNGTPTITKHNDEKIHLPSLLSDSGEVLCS